MLARVQRARASRRGFTLIEMIITLIVLLVSVSIYSGTVIATTGIRRTNHQNRAAADAIRTVVESMNCQEFQDLFALYNGDPKDDPGKEGSAPGNRFDVPGLEPADGNTSVGEILFPASVEVTEKDEKKNEKGEEPEGDGVRLMGVHFPGVRSYSTWQLREDADRSGLGVPRDLNGDSRVDAEDHSEDYVRLPVCVRATWRGPNGTRQLQVFTMFADVRHRDKKLVEARKKAMEKAEKEREKKRKDEEKAAEKLRKKEEKRKKEEAKEAEKLRKKKEKEAAKEEGD